MEAGATSTQPWVGRSVKRVEDERLLRGNGTFVADVNRPGQLHAVFVRSIHAHGRIRRIEAEAARALPGVAAVLTADDLPTETLPPFLWDTPPEKLVSWLRPELRPCHPTLLARDRVRYAGHAVAIVLATSRALAEDAAERVTLDVEPLPAVATTAAALAPDAPLVHDGWPDNVACRFVVSKGDVARALDRADVVVRERFQVQRQTGIPLETRAALADPAADGSLVVWATTQNAHPLRRALARMSGLPEERIRVVAPDVGGGFGIKGVLYPEDLVVALTALRLRRPVKWVEDRAEHMLAAIHARELEHEIELGLDRHGRILALRDVITVDAGAYNPLGLVIPYNVVAHLMGPYRVPAFHAHVSSVLTTKTPTAPYRGAGRPEAVFAVERALDLAARELDIDRVELRLRNMVGPDELPLDAGIRYRDGEQLVLDGGDYPAALRHAVELLGEEDPQDHGLRIGTGFACYVEGTGVGPYESARVSVDPDGRIVARTGACAQGQGHETVYAQIVADALGVSPADVEVIGGDTEGLERGWGTVASRSTVLAGNAAATAAGAVREQALAAAERLLEVAASDLTIVDGMIFPRGAPALAISLAAVATAAEARGERLDAAREFEPPTVTWANGVHAVRVAVNVETGNVEILRYVVVHDCGRHVNPMLVAGQVRGGVAQGIGAALYEEIVYDEDAQLLNGTLADYLVPTSCEIPAIVLDHAETPSPLNPLGVKGVGEGGAIGPPAAIANAIEDALRPPSLVIRRTPITPTVVRMLAAEREALLTDAVPLDVA